MPMYIPPNGFAGFAQQTAAVQRMGQRRAGGGTRKRRSKSKSQNARPRRKKAAAARGKPARLVKGSAAAKRYMASIRRKRKK